MKYLVNFECKTVLLRCQALAGKRVNTKQELSPLCFKNPDRVQVLLEAFRFSHYMRFVDRTPVRGKVKDLDELKAAYNQSAQAQLLDRIHREAKVERLYPNIPGLNPQKDGN